MYSTASVGSRTENRVRERRGGFGGAEEHPDAARVEELEPAQVDHDLRVPAVALRFQHRLGRRAVPEVHLAFERDLDECRPFGHTDLQLTHGRTGSLVPRARVGAAALPTQGRAWVKPSPDSASTERSIHAASSADVDFGGTVEMRPLRAASASDA